MNLSSVTFYPEFTVENTQAGRIELIIIVIQRCDNFEQDITIIAHVLLHISHQPRLIFISLSFVTIFRSFTVVNTPARRNELIIIVIQQSDNN